MKKADREKEPEDLVKRFTHMVIAHIYNNHGRYAAACFEGVDLTDEYFRGDSVEDAAEQLIESATED